MTTVEIRDITFTIDTADWSNADDALVAEEYMIDGLRALSAAQCADIAEFYADDDRDGQHPDLEAIEDEAFSAATAGWDSQPTSGHNCAINKE